MGAAGVVDGHVVGVVGLLVVALMWYNRKNLAYPILRP